MKYGVGMLTFDRENGEALIMEYGVMIRTVDRQQNYLRETLADFERSLAGHPPIPYELHLFDSGSPDPTWLDGLPGIHHFPAQKLTPNQNAVALMRGVAEVECDWVLFLEDDIAFCDDFLGSVDRWLTEHATPGRRVYSFYTPYHEVLRSYERGGTAWDYGINKFYGTQCIAMRREDALSAADGVGKIAASWKSSKGYDLLIKQWAMDRWPGIRDFLASVPSFVQHTGTESSISSGRFHSCDSFQGPDWSYKGMVHA